MVEISRVEMAKAEINTIKISKEKIAFFNTKPSFILGCVRMVMALMFSLSANAQQIGAEIEYVDDSATNQIPYFDNRFRIDEKLDEVTLIFYHRRGAKPIILIRPDGSKLNIDNYPEDKVQWFDDQTFDMLKIKSPMIGPWQVIGQVQAKSKIMVVSEIRLEVTPLPEIILQGETLKMVARLFNGDLIIDDPLFQDVLTLNVDFSSTNNSAFDNFRAAPIQLASFHDNGRGLDEYANDSFFTGEFKLDFALGEWQPIYIVTMPMITRELRQKPIVVQKNPVTISVITNQGENKTHVVTFTIDDSLVNADSILVHGKVTFPDQQVEPFTVMQEQGLTRTHTIAFTESGVHRIKVKVFGDIKNGREFQAILPEFTFNVDRGSNNLTSEQKNAQAIANAAIAAEKRAQIKATQEAKIANKQQATLLYIVGGNTLVIIIAALMFVFIRRKKRK
jgi:uncharacterized protein (TIGR03503 family)